MPPEWSCWFLFSASLFLLVRVSYPHLPFTNSSVVARAPFSPYWFFPIRSPFVSPHPQVAVSSTPPSRASLLLICGTESRSHVLTIAVFPVQTSSSTSPTQVVKLSCQLKFACVRASHCSTTKEAKLRPWVFVPLICKTSSLRCLCGHP